MTISTINTCNTVKVAAQSKLPSLFAEIHDLDLITKEFNIIDFVIAHLLLHLQIPPQYLLRNQKQCLKQILIQ